jgi:hypothetical protein
MEDDDMKKLLTFALIAILGLTQSACQMLQNKEDNHIARCKEIKSRMMFNGTTTNQTQAFQEHADQDKLNESWHDEDC